MPNFGANLINLSLLLINAIFAIFYAKTAWRFINLAQNYFGNIYKFNQTMCKFDLVKI